MLQEWNYYFQNTLRWRNLRKITVAQVQGTVYAAGLMLMWACDLIVAADNVYFADVVGTRLGMCGVEYFGHPWEFGPRRTKELMLTGDAIDVHEAHRLGMVSKIFPVDDLDERTLAYARRIAELPTMTALLIKESVNQTVDNMGFYNSLQACFTLHQLNHSHWAEIHESKYPVAEEADGIASWRDAPPVRLVGARTPWRGRWPAERRAEPDGKLGGTRHPREAPHHLPPARRGPVPAARRRLGRPDPRRPAVVAPRPGRSGGGGRRRRLDGAGLEAWWERWPGACGLGCPATASVVTWQLPNWWEALVLFRACWRCGAVAAPIHHQVGAAEVARVLADLEPALTLSTPGLPLAELVDAIGVRSGDDRVRATGRRAAPCPWAAGGGSDVAVSCCSPRDRPGIPRPCSTPTGAWPTRPCP